MIDKRKEYNQSRQELLSLLYNMVDELEHNPALRRRGPGFPFDLLESGIYQVFSALEGAVRHWALPVLESRLEWLRVRWDRLRS